jgi:pyruvate carboxylase
VDVMSYAQYPAVFAGFQAFKKEFEDVSVVDTRTFLKGLKIGASRLYLVRGHGKRGSMADSDAQSNDLVVHTKAVH